MLGTCPTWRGLRTYSRSVAVPRYGRCLLPLFIVSLLKPRRFWPMLSMYFGSLEVFVRESKLSREQMQQWCWKATRRSILTSICCSWQNRWRVLMCPDLGKTQQPPQIDINASEAHATRISSMFAFCCWRGFFKEKFGSDFISAPLRTGNQVKWQIWTETM